MTMRFLQACFVKPFNIMDEEHVSLNVLTPRFNIIYPEGLGIMAKMVVPGAAAVVPFCR